MTKIDYLLKQYFRLFEQNKGLIDFNIIEKPDETSTCATMDSFISYKRCT